MSDEVTLTDEYDLRNPDGSHAGHVRYYGVNGWTFEANSNGDDDTDLREISKGYDAWLAWRKYVLDNKLYIKDKKEAPPMEARDPGCETTGGPGSGGAKATHAPRTDTPEFTPPGEGWIEGRPATDRYYGDFETIIHYTRGAGDKSWYRPLPEPPIELPTEEGTVIEVKWKPNSAIVPRRLMLWSRVWYAVGRPGFYYPNALVGEIDSYEVISRPVVSVAKEVAKDVLADVRGTLSNYGFTNRQALDAVAVKWGVK